MHKQPRCKSSIKEEINTRGIEEIEEILRGMKIRKLNIMKKKYLMKKIDDLPPLEKH